MGLDKAKSLLQVKGDDTFLDLTAKQITSMRKEFGMKVKFMLMNSFSTSEDTLAFLKEKYPALASEVGLEMMQNKVPKLDATTYEVSIFLCFPKVAATTRRQTRKLTFSSPSLLFRCC